MLILVLIYRVARPDAKKLELRSARSDCSDDFVVGRQFAFWSLRPEDSAWTGLWWFSGGNRPDGVDGSLCGAYLHWCGLERRRRYIPGRLPARFNGSVTLQKRDLNHARSASLESELLRLKSNLTSVNDEAIWCQQEARDQCQCAIARWLQDQTSPVPSDIRSLPPD